MHHVVSRLTELEMRSEKQKADCCNLPGGTYDGCCRSMIKWYRCDICDPLPVLRATVMLLIQSEGSSNNQLHTHLLK